MQQERGGSEERGQQNAQDRRLKPMQGGENQQQQQPQKCPRCESLNTKFCYYNNYSLSQPRYFCKTCRRYWTQGGTLRNVPVGGGCRKGKRAKTSSSGENSRSSQSLQQAPPQQLQQNLTTAQNILSSNPVITTGQVLRTMEPGNLAAPSISSMASYYPTGGFLSSLASIQTLNPPQSFTHQSLNQALNIGAGDQMGGSSNLGLFQGYSVPSFGSSQQQRIQPTQIYQVGNRENIANPPMYPQSEESLIHSSRPGGSSQHDWNQSFINNTNPNVSDTVLWSISTSSSGNANSNTNTGSGSSSLNPNQWPDLAGYGPPP